MSARFSQVHFSGPAGGIRKYVLSNIFTINNSDVIFAVRAISRFGQSTVNGLWNTTLWPNILCQCFVHDMRWLPLQCSWYCSSVTDCVSGPSYENNRAYVHIRTKELLCYEVCWYVGPSVFCSTVCVTRRRRNFVAWFVLPPGSFEFSWTFLGLFDLVSEWEINN